MPKLPSMLDADLKGKVVFVRMDHNVVKKGKIKDPMRIDATIPTLLHIYKQGGLPVLMSHVGRPYDKKTGEFTISDNDSVAPIVKYIEDKLQLKGLIPECEAPIVNVAPVAASIAELKAGKVDFVYLPNTRWFRGEEAKDESAQAMATALAGLADVYINDAFGSWQAHTTTVGLAEKLPAYAGLLMLKEIGHLEQIFEPQRPLLAIVAGAKFDTKIGPLSSLIKIADKLLLGGVINNAYLCVKYGVRIKGVAEEDIAMARTFFEATESMRDKIIEPEYIVESDSIEERASFRRRSLKELSPGMELNYVLDVDPASFAVPELKAAFEAAGTIFINAVMGLTSLFGEGTSAMYSLIAENRTASKLYGGGDTIQDFRDLLPGLFAKAVNDPSYYFFTGGGAILDAIQQGSPYGMKPIKTLIEQSK